MAVTIRGRGKKLTLNNLVNDIRHAINLEQVEIAKKYMSATTSEAMLTIPTTGSGYLAKKTVVTTGRGKPSSSRADVRAAIAKLGRRRRGNSQADLKRSMMTALNKIDRMKEDRVARALGRQRTLLNVVFGTYYSRFVSPRYDTARRKLPKVVEARLRRRKLKS